MLTEFSPPAKASNVLKRHASEAKIEKSKFCCFLSFSLCSEDFNLIMKNSIILEAGVNIVYLSSDTVKRPGFGASSFRLYNGRCVHAVVIVGSQHPRHV